MAGRQTIVENGRVTTLFKALSTIAATLVVGGIYGIFAGMNQLNSKIDQLKDQLAQKNTLDAIQNLNYENAENEHAKFDRRITALERERDSQRDNR